MYMLRKSERKASARDQIDIKGVRAGILMLQHDRYRAILNVSPLNFELKSEDEQDAIIATFESFLNSVGCAIQILIRTREIDIDKYLSGIKLNSIHEKEAVYRTQLENYSDFIQGLIATNKILSRVFYIIVPYTSTAKVDFEGVQEQLNLRVDIVRRGLARLGMTSRSLNDLEVLDLFYSFYNPERAKTQPLSSRALELLHTEYIQKGLLGE